MSIAKLKCLFAFTAWVLPAAFTSVLHADIEVNPAAPRQENVAPAIPQKFESDAYRVEKKVISAGQLGEPAKYAIRIEVVGEQGIEQVRVSETLPAGMDFVGAEPAPEKTPAGYNWVLGKMEKGAVKEIVLTVIPRIADMPLWTNTKVIAYPVLLAVPLQVGVPKLEIAKTGPTAPVERGDAANFVVTVKNTGTAPATDVVVTDTLSEGLSTGTENAVLNYNLGTLNPGDSKTIEIATTAVAAGDRESTAQLTSKQLAPRYAKAKIHVVESKVAISQEGPATRFIFADADYAVRVRNIGTGMLTNVAVTEALPENVRVVSASDNGTVSEKQVSWTIEKLAPGEEIVRKLTLSGTALGKVTNVASVTAGRLTESVSLVTEWEGAPGVSTEIADDLDPVKVGDIVTYTVKITNQSGHKHLTGDAIVQFTAGMEPVEAGKDAKAVIEGQRIVIKNIMLEPKVAVTLQVKAKATKAGAHNARLEFGAGFLPRTIVKEESTYVY